MTSYGGGLGRGAWAGGPWPRGTDVRMYGQTDFVPFGAAAQKGSKVLDASLHFYKRLCPSVGPSVDPSVRQTVCPSPTFCQKQKTNKK